MRDELTDVDGNPPDGREATTVATPLIRVLVVDDHGMLAASLAAMIDGEPDMTVVGAVSTLAEARAFMSHRQPDVVLLDHRLPDGMGAFAVAELKTLAPGARVLVMSAAVDDAAVIAATEQGASGFISKTSSLEEVLAALRLAAAGDVVLGPSLLARLLPRLGARAGAARTVLSARELEVLQLLTNGRNSREISGDLHLSLNTVRNHIQSILGKLGVHSKLEAVSKAIGDELVTPPRSTR